jgi:hypothetical protein
MVMYLYDVVVKGSLVREEGFDVGGIPGAAGCCMMMSRNDPSNWTSVADRPRRACLISRPCRSLSVSAPLGDSCWVRVRVRE